MIKSLTLIFLKTLLLSGSVTILYTASGGNPTSTSTLRLQREPLGTVTCQKEYYITYTLKVDSYRYLLNHLKFDSEDFTSTRIQQA